MRGMLRNRTKEEKLINLLQNCQKRIMSTIYKFITGTMMYFRKNLGFISIKILLYNNMKENNTQVVKADINI